jgi:hypothetical protein
MDSHTPRTSTTTHGGGVGMIGVGGKIISYKY